MVAAENNTYVVYNSSDTVTVAVSHDFGLSYSFVNVSADGTSSEATIDAFRNNVYVAWEDQVNGARLVFVASSHDNGTTFSTPYNLAPTSNNSREPRLAISPQNGFVYATWREDPSKTISIVYVASSQDKGMNFTSQAVSPNNTVSRESTLLAVGSNVYALFRVRILGNYDASFAKSSDNGATFSQPMDLSGPRGITSIRSEENTPAMALEGSNIYFAWNNNTSVLDRMTNDSGVTSSPVTSLSSGLNTLVGDQYVIWLHNSTAIDFAVI